jgi:hypothetical protein
MPNGTLRQHLDGFIGKYVLYYGDFFCILKPDMISAVYRVDIVCRISDGKLHYVKFTGMWLRE